MFRKIVAVWVSLAMLAGFVVIVDVVTDFTPSVRANTITVDDSGGADYLTIQEGIDAAIPGDTVFVKNGIYYENVLVNKTINLTGESINSTIINGGGNGDVVTVNMDLVNISGFTITNSGSVMGDAGIQLDSDYNAISDNIFSQNNDSGVWVNGSSRNIINDNIFSLNGRFGIYVHSSNNCTITDNNISNKNWNGIILESSKDNNISNNHLSTVYVGIELGSSSNNSVTKNNISSSDTGIMLQVNSPNNNIEANNISNAWYGICLDYSSNNSIKHNIISTIDSGIELGGESLFNNIGGNNISGNFNGIKLGSDSNNNQISDNYVYDNSYGITIYDTSNNSITNNCILNNTNGIFMQICNWCNITDNNVSKNYQGMVIDSTSNINITGNNFLYNGWGLSLVYSLNSHVSSNHFTRDGVVISGPFITHYNSHDISTNNVVNGKPLRYYKDETGIIVDGMTVGQIILVNCQDTVLKNLDIFATDVGVEIAHSTNISITNNNVSMNEYYGIYFTASYKNRIIYNNISNNMDTGIHLVGPSSYNDIIQNFVSCNNGHGISLSWGLTSSYNNITDNNIILNNRSGIMVSSSNNNITNNNISGNKNNGIDFGSIPSTSYNNVTYNNITGNNWSGIDMSSSLYSNIENNNISNNNYSGITHGGLSTSSYNSIAYNNIFNNNKSGIELATSKDNNIDNNNITNNKNNGIILGVTGVPSSIRNNITHNHIMYNNWSGIHLASSYSNISNNSIIGNEGNGIIIGGAFSSSDHNCVRNNNISLNKGKGVYIYGSFSSDSITNLVIYNNISHNFYGFYLESTTSNNKIYHNNIINNTNQAFDARIFGNQWDNGYPSGGNYWSDYTGNDNNKGPNQNQPGSDGIGDTNYSIDVDSRDNYPLMEPYTYKPLDNYTILKQGWNLISIPLIQNNQDITKALEMIDGYYDAVQWYDPSVKNDPWKHHKVGKPFGNDLSHLNESMGFWIHITNPGDTIFIYNGTQPSSNQSITLHPGWNMVGYPSLINRTRDNALNNIVYGSDVDSIWTFNAATQTWQEIGPSDYFELGRGYWIHSKVTKVWDVPL